MWDSNDYSCAYDTLFSCLFDMWDEFRPLWTERFGSLGLCSSKLAAEFDSVHGGKQALDTARDNVRALLTRRDPQHFPRGRSLTALDRLTTSMFGANSWGVLKTMCTNCSAQHRPDGDLTCNLSVTHNNQLIDKHKTKYSLSHWLKAQRVSTGDYKCRSCERNTVAQTVFLKAPPLLFIHLPVHAINIDAHIEVRVKDTPVPYLLRGVIYLGGNHFTARIIRRNGQSWYHDGQLHGGAPVCEGNLLDQAPDYLYHHTDATCRRKAVGALYALADI